jgi:Flp pilus assembly protein CpaB
MMETEFKDTGRSRRLLVVVGIVLALVAGVGAFLMMSGAQAPTAEVVTRTVLVAAHDIPARTIVGSADLTLRQVPEDPSLTQAFSDPVEVIDRLTAVTILANQPITPNLLASGTAGGQFSILSPEETLSPDSPIWRAIAVNVPDDRAVGGQVQVGQHVDVFVTAQINVALPPAAVAEAAGDVAGGNDNAPTGPGASPGPQGDPDLFYADKSTKVTYQDIVILAKEGTLYILKVDEHLAEEISHLQAAGNASFSLALRPDGDHRIFDTADYGETTNMIIEEYGLPIPEIYPVP